MPHLSGLETKLESLLDLTLAGLVDDRERYLDPDGTRWEPLGAGGTSHAAHWTPQRHNEAREHSRQLVDENGFALNAIENRISYVIGAGHVYRVDPLPGVAADDDAVIAVNRLLVDFQERNHWYARQIETQRRLDRDGEVIFRLFTGDDGETALRYVEPETIHPPENAVPTLAPHGIEFAPADAETAERYWIDNEPVDAADIQHRKLAVDLNCPRGIPLLWPVRRGLRRAALMLRNMSALIEVQTAIALIRKHAGLSTSGIEQFAAGAADYSATNQVTGKTEHFRRYGPGTILDVPRGMEYEFPNIGLDSSRIVEPLRAELRAIAARLVMPEFMFTSDASNAAYASTMVAEGPAVRNFERIQWTTIADDLDLMRRVVRRAEAAGAVPPGALAKCVISAEAPHVQVRDYLKQNTVHKIAHAAGILSPQTWAQKLGLDYTREQNQIAAHRAVPGADATPDAPTRTTQGLTDPPNIQSPYNP